MKFLKFIFPIGLLSFGSPLDVSAQHISLIEGPCSGTVQTGVAPSDTSVAGSVWSILGVTPDCVPSGVDFGAAVGGIAPGVTNVATATQGGNFHHIGSANTSNGSAFEGLMTTAVNLVPSAEYCFSMDIMYAMPMGTVFSTSNEMVPGFISLNLGGTTGSFVATQSWVTNELTFVAPAATMTVAFQSNTSGVPVNGGQEPYTLHYVDNAQITPGACENTPTPPNSSSLQSQAAIQTFRYTREHIASRLGTSGQEHDNYLLQFNFEDEDRNISNGGRWTVLALSDTDLDGVLPGQGTFVSALAGWDMNEGKDSLWGYILGAELGDWTYDSVGSVEKLGLSAGIYGGRRLGERGLLEGHLTYTRFLNAISSATGDEASFQSDRLIGHLSLSGKLGNSGRASVTPFLEADYAVERIPAYSLGSVLIAGETVEVGLISLGAEITTPWNPRYGQFFVRVQADQTFGETAMTLSNGTVINPYEDVTGTLGLGWISNTSYDSIGRFEMSVSDIGNDEKMETRLEGHWERNF